MSSSERRRFVKACEKMIGRQVERVEYPGGKSRDSVRLILEDRTSIYATRRKNEKISDKEARVLTSLFEAGAPVPKVLGFKDGILLQQDLGNLRLSQALADVSNGSTFELLHAALESLTRIHRAAEAAGLDETVPPIGRNERWIDGLLGRPKEISKELGMTAPSVDFGALKSMLLPGLPRLVKWDARPGNALLLADGTVAWIDWEHCGARQRLDDLVWLLGDEATPEAPDAEERLLGTHVPVFADGRALDEALDYIAVLGCFHLCVRLELILGRKGDGEWWDASYCLEKDKVGVTPEAVARLCARGGRWSARNRLTRPLARWFEAVCEQIGSLGPRSDPAKPL